MPRFLITNLTILFFSGIFITCNKPEQVRVGTQSQSTEIIIEMNAPATIYENNKRVLLDASPTNLANKKRIYYFWTCTSFPINSKHKIVTPRGAATIVDSVSAGKYTFLLEATDDLGNKARKNLELDVLQDTLIGRPPVILPLPDQSLYLPGNQIYLQGDINYQVNPLHRELTFKWSVIQQPTGSPVVNFSNATSANTYASRFAVGSYLFRLELRNEAGLSVSDTMELKVFPDSLSGLIKVYENVPWILEDIGWGPYTYLLIGPSEIYANKKTIDIDVRIWDIEKQDWFPSADFYWFIYEKNLTIYSNDYDYQKFVGKSAKVMVTFL